MTDGLKARATELNRRSWDAANVHFAAAKGSYAEVLARAPTYPTEILELLEPINLHKSILHLFCNDGRETALWSLLRGCICTGVDISSVAIENANQLTQQLGLSNTFECADAFEYLERLDCPCYDRVILTLGSLRWIPDLRRFMEVVQRCLSPDGKLVIWDFHPIAVCMTTVGEVVKSYPLTEKVYERQAGVFDYVSDASRYATARGVPIQSRNYEPQGPVIFAEYGLAYLLTVAIDAGLNLDAVRELDFSWEERLFDGQVQDEGSLKWLWPESSPSLPVTFAATWKMRSERER